MSQSAPSECRLLPRTSIVTEVEDTDRFPEHPQLRTGVETPGWPAGRPVTWLRALPQRDPHATPDDGCY